MTPLTNITGLPAEAAELLEAAGIRSTNQLSLEKPQTLHAKLELIAWQRGRSSKAPALDQLEHWVAVAGMLSSQPELAALNVDEIPEAVPLSRSRAWVPPSLRATPPSSTEMKQPAAADPTQPDSEPEIVRLPPAPATNAWRKVDPSSFATIEDYNEGRSRVQPLSRESLEPSNAAPTESDDDSEEANRRRPLRLRSNGETLSRWVKRGVVHPRPIHTWFGAVVSLLWRIAFLTGIGGFIYLVVRVETPSTYTQEVIAGSVALAVLGFLQLHFAGRSRCRICSCNLFYSKNCHKNRKAHLIPPLGYVATLSLHLLVFGWFRCMYCGTAIRLRPSPPRRLTDDA